MIWTPFLEEWYHNLPDEHKEEWFEERTLCDASLFYFIKQIGGSVNRSGGDISEYLHKPICDFWQDRTIKRKAVYMPRNWKKSTCLTCWGNIYEYLQDNELRILVASQKEERASDWLDWMGGQILSNLRLRWLYPELIVVDKKYKNKNKFSGKQIVLPRPWKYPDPTFRAIGIIGGAQGGHYDIVSPDDITSEKAMESDLILEDAMRWVDNMDELLLEDDLSKPDASEIRITGTHWAQGDIGCYIQNEYKEFQWKIVPALKDEELEDTENIKWIQNPNADQGESNWPEMFPTETYKRKMNNPQKEMVFWTQDQNNPDKTGGGLNKYDLAWFRYFEIEERDEDKAIILLDAKGDPTDEVYLLKEVPKHGIIDPSHFAETRSIKAGSRCAVFIAAQPYDTEKIIVLYAWAGKPKEPSDFLAQIYKADELFHPRLWHIETFGGQEFMYKFVRQYGRKEYWKIKITDLPKDVGKDAKDRRIAEVLPTAESHKIYIHKKFRDLITEIKNWPSGLTKDLVDCLGWYHQEIYIQKKKVRPDTDKHNRRRDFIKAKGRIGVV